MAGIFVTRGDLDGAMRLYQESLAIKEALGDRQGKSATLHQMAGIFVTRGDLDGAMRLYQEALEAYEALGDRQGKSATLANMGVVLLQMGQLRPALEAFLESFLTLQNMGAAPDARAVAGWLIRFRREVGREQFDPLWHDVTAGAPRPDWLSADAPTPAAAAGRGESAAEGEGLSLEAWVQASVQAARQRSAQAGEWFGLAQRVAASRQYPPEIQALAQVLQRILLGESEVDLSALPEELAALVRREVG
jgi:tetratricopeptide (TPR) repeat protein